MAGNAQSKLGELFVDIGVNGLGKILKGLNSVSASFLLTKNAATQLVKPIVNMTHQFGQSAIGLEKMKLTFGTTIEQAQRMQAAFKKLGMQELSGDIQRISDLLAAKNYQGLGENFMAAMSKMNIDIRDYNGSLESTLDLFDKISDGLEQITQGEGAEQARFWAKQISSDYTNLMFAKSQGIRFSNLPQIANEYSQAEVDELINGEQRLIELQQRVYQAMGKIFVDHQQPIERMIDKLGSFADKAPEFIRTHLKAIEKTLKTLLVAYVGNMLGGRAGAIAALGGWAMAKTITGGQRTVFDYEDDETKIPSNLLPKIIRKYTPEEYAKRHNLNVGSSKFDFAPDLDKIGESNLLGNRIVKVVQNITTPDSTQAARKAVDGIREAENRATAHQLGSLRD